MKRIALFLVLAIGGIAALAVLNGGLGGRTLQGPPPVVAEMPVVVHPPGGPKRVTMDELPSLSGGKSGRSVPIEADPAESVNSTIAGPVTFVDPAAGERIEIPNAPTASVSLRKATPTRDASGLAGVSWQTVHIVMYKDKKDYTRAIAEALRANPATGRKGLELYDITADDGYETAAAIPPTPGEAKPGSRTVIHLTKNVVIHDYVKNLDIRTSDALVEYEARTAEGRAPVEVESATFLVKGRGFRVDRKTQRLEILENTEYEAITSPEEARKLLASGASKGMRPRRVTAKGSTVIVGHKDEKPSWTDVRLEGGVHAEMSEGQQLDAETVSLRLAESASDGTAKDAADGKGSRPILERLTADGDVRYDGKDDKGALLTAQGPKLAVEYGRDEGVRAIRLAGRSIVTWRGVMPGRRLAPGEHPASHIVSAKATESILFAPDAETADGSLIDLVGAARVEYGRAPTDAAPQRIAADRITLHLRPEESPPEVTPRTTAPDAGRRKSMFGLIPTSFAATGGVILEGPVLSGAAREIKGFDLDRPIYHVTATGPDAHLDVADDPEPKPAATAATVPARPGERAGPSPTASGVAATPDRKWTPHHLAARENAVGSFRVREGEGGVTFSGDSIQYARATGAEIRAGAGRDAHLTLEGRENRDQTIDANTIWLRQGAEERILETAGRTHTVVYVGETTPTSAPTSSGPGRRVVELRSGSRIDITGSQGTKETDATLAVKLIDGGAMSVRTDGVVTDRLTATTIELSLVETVPVPGELGFALSGRRTNEPRAEKPDSAAGPASAKPTPAKPPERLVIDSDTLSLAIGTESQAGSSGGLRRVRAAGNVRAVKEGREGLSANDDPTHDRTQFEGAQFDYDAKSGTGVLIGAGKKYAVVTLGREPALDRFLSPRIDLAFRDGRMSRAVFAAPVRGVFRKKAAAGPGPTAIPVPLVDRFVFDSFGGPLTVDGTTATIDGTAQDPVHVEFTKRDASDAAIGDPMTITTLQMTLATSRQFGGPGSTFVATGPGTRMEKQSNDPAKRESAEGDVIRFEMPPGGKPGAPGATEGVLRITSKSGIVRVRQGGNAFEGDDVFYDLATGKFGAQLRRANLGGAK